MSDAEPRLLFDECLAGPAFKLLADLVDLGDEPSVRIVHFFDLAPSGTRDEDWMPKLKDGQWTVITADGGRKPNRARGKKLPQLCYEYGITLILLSPAVHDRNTFDKTRTIFSVWARIIEIACDPSSRGNRYSLEPAGRGDPGLGRLVERMPRRDNPRVSERNRPDTPPDRGAGESGEE